MSDRDSERQLSFNMKGMDDTSQDAIKWGCMGQRAISLPGWAGKWPPNPLVMSRVGQPMTH